MHQTVLHFVNDIARAHASHSRGRVLEAGSLNINGSVRDLFPEASEYIGVDYASGEGVDWSGWFHEFPIDLRGFDVVVSTEMLEHNPFWDTDVVRMRQQLRPGGLFILTCAPPNRGEHGTAKNGPDDNPALARHPDYKDYYRGLTAAEITHQLGGFEILKGQDAGMDTFVWGIK